MVVICTYSVKVFSLFGKLYNYIKTVIDIDSCTLLKKKKKKTVYQEPYL